MVKSAPGKHYREGISIIELTDMFPTEQSATEWFESLIWPNGRHCPRCGCTETSMGAILQWRAIFSDLVLKAFSLGTLKSQAACLSK